MRKTKSARRKNDKTVLPAQTCYENVPRDKTSTLNRLLVTYGLPIVRLIEAKLAGLQQRS